MKTITVNGRSWDSYEGYLFDIDGTLLHAQDAVHYFAFCEALKQASGRDLTLEGVVTQGNVDNGILRDALQLAGVDEAQWRPRRTELQQGMCAYVHAHRDDFRLTVLPAVTQVLDHLTANGAVLGTATGNLREIGSAKLEHAGLLAYFQVGGWSDAFESRADVFRGAMKLMRTATHTEAALCVIGDTPSDIVAAQANHLPVIAVATGIYPRSELQALKPDLCLDSLSDLLDSNQTGARQA